MEEISLRDLIEVLLKNKKIIATTVVLSLIISISVSYFVLEPVYEAKTILMASNLYNKQEAAQSGEGIEGLLQTMSQYPQMSIETYKEQINNPHILEQTIEDLKLEEKGITRSNLKNMLSLNTIKDTNLISIAVKYTNKSLAKDIANTIARSFTDFVSTKAKEQATKSSIYIKQQMDVEKQNLDKVMLEYKEYLSKPRGLNELQKEVDSKLELITQYKTDSLNTSIDENKIRASLAAAEKQLNSTPQKFTVSKALMDEPYVSQILEDSTGKSSSELFATKIETEEVNNSYVALKDAINNLNIELAKTVAQKNNLNTEIGNLQKELETLQSDLGIKQHEDIIMQEKVKFAQDTYNAFLKTYEETRISQSSAIGDASIIIISSAVEPLQPVAPNKRMIVAMGTLLGLVAGIFIAYAKYYWQISSPVKN